MFGVKGRSGDPLPAPVDPCALERFFDTIRGIECQALFFSDRLVSDVGADHLGKGFLRILSPAFECETWSEGGESGFSSSGLDNGSRSGPEGECCCLADDGEKRLRGIAKYWMFEFHAAHWEKKKERLGSEEEEAV